MTSTEFVLFFHFTIANPGLGAPVYAETLGPVSADRCEEVAAAYRQTKPSSGRNDVACIRVPNDESVQRSTRWYDYLHHTYLDMANCVQVAPGDLVPFSAARRVRYVCSKG